MIDLKIDRETLVNHLNYSKFIYIGAIIAALVLVNIVYTMTAPQMPEENKIDIYSYCGFGDEDIITEWESEMLDLLPQNQRQVNFLSNSYMDTIETAIVARIAASEGDIIMLQYEDMSQLMGNYAFTPLEDIIDIGIIEESNPNIDWSLYTYADEDGNEHIYILPLDGAVGLYEIENYPIDNCIGIFYYSKNIDNAVTCVDYIINKTQYDGEIPQYSTETSS